MTDAPGLVNSAVFAPKKPVNDGAATAEATAPTGDIVSLRTHNRVTGGQFILGQNYPNPHVGETTVPFTLANPSDVRLDILDLQGRKVAGVVRKGRSPGTQSIKLNLSGLGLPPGDYVYELQVTTRHGLYRQSMLMTAE